MAVAFQAYTLAAGFAAGATEADEAETARRFDDEFWLPAACTARYSVLQIGCGTGKFLAYLQNKGVVQFVGVDDDTAAIGTIARPLAYHVHDEDIAEFLAHPWERRFERVAMFDLLGQLDPTCAAAILSTIRADWLTPGGRLVVRVPNAAAAEGKDRHHPSAGRMAFTPGSLRQLGLAAGYAGITCLPQVPVSGMQRLTQRTVQWLSTRALVEPPAIRTPSFIAVLDAPG